MAENSRLPPRVRARVFALADQEGAIQTAMQSNLRHISELAKAHDLASDEQSRIELKEENRRRQELLEAQRDRHRALADLNAKIRRLLDLLPAETSLEDAKPAKVKLKAGQTHQQAVAELRMQIASLIGERGKIERSSPTTKEMKAQAKRYVQSLAEQYPPRLIVEHNRFDLQFGRGVVGEREPAPLEMLTWIAPELVQRRLEDLIDAMPKPERQLSAEDRAQHLAEIKSELFDLERLECALISDAMDGGTFIEQRANVDIKALHGIVVAKSKARAA